MKERKERERPLLTVVVRDESKKHTRRHEREIERQRETYKDTRVEKSARMNQRVTQVKMCPWQDREK